MKNKTIYASFFGLLFLQTTASAEVILGYVQKVDPANDTVFIHRVDRDGQNNNLPAELELKVLRDAKLKNIASLHDLKKDSPVKVDANQNKDLGLWEAKSVELNQEAIGNAYKTNR